MHHNLYFSYYLCWIPGSYSGDYEGVTACNVIEIYRRFGRMYCLNLQSRKISKASSNKSEPHVENQVHIQTMKT
jgi:hypothetical protein